MVIQCEKKIEASSATEAIQIFKNQSWYDADEEYAKQKKKEAEDEAARVVPPDIQSIMRKARYEKGKGIYLQTVTLENVSAEEYDRLKEWCNDFAGKIVVSVYERPTTDNSKATITIHEPVLKHLKHFIGDIRV